MKHRLAAALAVFSFCSAAVAQQYSTISQSTVIGRNFGYPSGTVRPDLPDNPQGLTAVGDLDLVVESAFFANNLEYGGHVDGQTFIGFLAPVRLRYRVHELLTLEAGMILGHNFGDEDGIDVIEPIVRLVYEPWRDMFFIAGTIIPTHWIHDALLDDVQKFRTPDEQGFQFRADTEHLKNDTWINWRVREGRFNSEKFEVANSTQLRWSGARADLQLIEDHTGGQLNVLHNTLNQVVGYGGGSFGTEGTDWLKQYDWVHDVRVHGGYFESSDDALANKRGHGWEVGAYADLHVTPQAALHPFVSYFHSDNFSAPRGDLLYSSYSDYTQYGVTAIFNLAAGFCAEGGFAVQPTHFAGKTDPNYSFQFNFVWGRGFKLLTLK